MDFNDTPQEAEFRAEVRAWLDNNQPEDWRKRLKDKSEYMAVCKEWQMRKYEGGWACMHWPKEYGGRASTPIERVIWSQEEGELAAMYGPFAIGQGMAGPVMMTYATEEQKRQYLPKLASGEEIWCQLFSEPVAGSDLAGLKTRSEKQGDTWVVNGQKVWTSGAHYSDYGILVTRHDPTQPKHRGLTYFFLSMKSEGVDVRPIKQVSGESGFNEVFFNNVKIPDAQRLGEIGDGWQVSITTLMNERMAVGGGNDRGVDDMLELASRMELEDGLAVNNPAVRSKLADAYVKVAGLQYTKMRRISALSRGETPGPESSITKLVEAANRQDMASLMMDLEGASGALTNPEAAEMSARFQNNFLSSPGFRIAGGTDEILRNIISERVLGLPADIRVDKKVAYNEIPSGTVK